MHKYNTIAITLIQHNLDNSHAASSVAAMHINKHRPPASRDTAQVDCACRIPEDITRMLACVFSCISHRIWDYISEKYIPKPIGRFNRTHLLLMGLCM